jgi:hypothetical protein
MYCSTQKTAKFRNSKTIFFKNPRNVTVHSSAWNQYICGINHSVARSRGTLHCHKTTTMWGVVIWGAVIWSCHLKWHGPHFIYLLQTLYTLKYCIYISQTPKEKSTFVSFFWMLIFQKWPYDSFASSVGNNGNIWGKLLWRRPHGNTDSYISQIL